MDWKLAAKAMNTGIPDDQLERIVPVLETLEKSFRPLADSITWELEPATDFDPEAGI
jgi:hypothetical protein